MTWEQYEFHFDDEKTKKRPKNISKRKKVYESDD